MKDIQVGEVFKLKDLISYQEGEIARREVAKNSKMKFILMAFDGVSGLAEHEAPMDAILFALEGSAVLCYEGTDYQLEAGDNFHMAKGGVHSLKTETPFKMGLLLAEEE